MVHLDWVVLESKYAMKEKYMTVRVDRCLTPDNRMIEAFYVLERPDLVHMVAITKDRNVVMIEQYRHGIGKTILELPSGCVDHGETPLEAAKRELQEETGYVSDNMIEVARFAVNPADHTNTSHCFLALDVEYAALAESDEVEQINTVLLSIDDVAKMLQDGLIVHTLHISSLFFALNVLRNI